MALVMLPAGLWEDVVESTQLGDPISDLLAGGPDVRQRPPLEQAKRNEIASAGKGRAT
jgi:hypothetical protein